MLPENYHRPFTAVINNLAYSLNFLIKTEYAWYHKILVRGGTFSRDMIWEM